MPEFQSLIACLGVALLVACTPQPGGSGPDTASRHAAAQTAAPPLIPLREAYFGELHVHTGYSLDAFALGTFAGPDVAYRFGRGEEVRNPGGESIRLRVPLDFVAVTDHAEWLGEYGMIQDSSQPAYLQPFAVEARAAHTDGKTFRHFFNWIFDAERSAVRPPFSGPEGRTARESARTIWAKTVESAERYNQPGRFTTFVGFEWTATPGGANLHRNIIFRTALVPTLPVSFFEVQTPEALWTWMERVAGGESNVLAIPHNSNLSNGLMFDPVTTAGLPYDAELAARRQAAEPLTEIMQIKGVSESNPAFAPNDELIDFELMPPGLNFSKKPAAPARLSWVREGLKEGLIQADRLGVNPFEYGFVGGTDNHSAAPGDVEESSFHGSDGVFSYRPEQRIDDEGSLPMNPGALTGVWARSNTREELWQSMKRRETFATSGTRLKVRFFAGWNYPQDLATRGDWLSLAYRQGVPMGQRLNGGGQQGSPTFVVWALKAPESARLDRIQIVKGWSSRGVAREAIFDVVCADARTPDPQTHRCGANRATVNLTDCVADEAAGGAQLRSTWKDPTFDATQRAFYYARVIENPTCRWSSHDAHRLGRAPPAGVPPTIKERAWSSPIWYLPPTSEAAHDSH